MMIVGGDFTAKDSVQGNCAFTTDAGRSWQPVSSPNGYRSCVEWMGRSTWVTCGLNGVDYTKDDAKSFITISTDGYHVCRKAKKGKSVFFAGGNGRIGKLVMP